MSLLPSSCRSHGVFLFFWGVRQVCPSRSAACEAESVPKSRVLQVLFPSRERNPDRSFSCLSKFELTLWDPKTISFGFWCAPAPVWIWFYSLYSEHPWGCLSLMLKRKAGRLSRILEPKSQVKYQSLFNSGMIQSVRSTGLLDLTPHRLGPGWGCSLVQINKAHWRLFSVFATEVLLLVPCWEASVGLICFIGKTATPSYRSLHVRQGSTLTCSVGSSGRSFFLEGDCSFLNLLLIVFCWVRHLPSITYRSCFWLLSL